MTTGSPDEERLPHYPLKPLYTRPAPAAAPERAAPTDGCGACGDVCQSRAAETERPCRTCSPEGCPDSTACPREGGAA